MKAHNPDRFCLHPSSPHKTTLLLFALVAAALFGSGCHKKSASDKSPSHAPEPTVLVPANTPPAGPPVAQRPPVNRATQAITADANTDVVLEKLSQELRRYVAYTRTIPKSFEEFAAHNTVQFPPAPAGKKYAIEQGKVILESK